MSSLEPVARLNAAQGRTSGLALVVAVGLVAICLTVGGCREGVSEPNVFQLPPLRRSIWSQTYVYKIVDGLQIRADVHRFADTLDVVRPVVIWIHGGALISGNREDILFTRRLLGEVDELKERLVEAEYVVVSIDYRLAPETKLSSIIEDLEDAFAWVRARGPELFNADTSRIAVMGGSAGGYLTLTSGLRIERRWAPDGCWGRPPTEQRT